MLVMEILVCVVFGLFAIILAVLAFLGSLKKLDDLLAYLEKNGFEISLFRWCIKHIINILNVIVNFFNLRERASKKYYETLRSRDFLEWETKILSILYQKAIPKGASGFVKLPRPLDDYPYPIVIYEPESVNADTNLNFVPSQLEEYRLNSWIQWKYWWLVGAKITHNVLGFGLHELALNDKGKVQGVSTIIGDFKQNVYTSHILQYELYCLYRDEKNFVFYFNYSPDQILEKLPLRKKIHDGIPMEKWLTTGVNRFSELSVLGLEVCQRQQTVAGKKEYQAYVSRSSKKLALPGGLYKLIPAGAYDTFLPENSTPTEVQLKGYWLRLALHREYLEEVFDQEYKYNKDNKTEQNVIEHEPPIAKLREMCQSDPPSAEERFLGVSVNLALLRHNFCYLIFIDSQTYYSDLVKASDTWKRKSNDETTENEGIPVSDIAEHIKDARNLNPDSAGLYYLALRDSVYRKL